MKVGYVQFEPVFGEKERNLKSILKWLDKGATYDSNLLILPELCNSGYTFRTKREVTKLSEEVPEGQTTKVLTEFTKENGIHVVAGLCEREGERRYNSAVSVGPEGFINVYRKAHLFDREKLFFSEGNTEFAVHDASKTKIGIMMCFDWFFPEVTRTLALKGAQVICHPANLILPYCQTALLGTAVQNKVFIITANRVGMERGVEFTGESQIIDPNMRILAKSGRNSEEAKVVEIDPKLADNKWVTKRNNIWTDRRTDLFHFSLNKI